MNENINRNKELVKTKTRKIKFDGIQDQTEEKTRKIYEMLEREADRSTLSRNKGLRKDVQDIDLQNSP
jgi:hypothetical protein